MLTSFIPLNSLEIWDLTESRFPPLTKTASNSEWRFLNRLSPIKALKNFKSVVNPLISVLKNTWLLKDSRLSSLERSSSGSLIISNSVSIFLCVSKLFNKIKIARKSKYIILLINEISYILFKIKKIIFLSIPQIEVSFCQPL